MKKSLILILLAAACSVTVFVVGFVTADRARYNNSFVRIFPPHAADINSVFKMRSGRSQLSEVSGRSVYLQDRKGILIVDLKKKDTSRIDLDIPSGSEVDIDAPYFFIHNGGTASLQRGNSRNWSVDTAFNAIPGFTAIETLSTTSVVLRTVNLAERQNVLLKTASGQRYILKKQVDGLLCTDGYLQYSKTHHQLVYTYRYRNQFICLDTNLNVVRIGKTIDTTFIAKISVAELDGKITMSKPPLVVNKGTCVDGKYLFVRSNLVARNESADEFKHRSVIDVYNILDGSYRFSFYIDNYEDNRMQDFKVKDTVLIAKFSNAIIQYDLPAKYLP